jgi:hypothetical protein
MPLDGLNVTFKPNGWAERRPTSRRVDIVRRTRIHGADRRVARTMSPVCGRGPTLLFGINVTLMPLDGLNVTFKPNGVARRGG